jgi:Fe-S oxidoreductase
VQHLGEFVREVEKILAAHGVESGIYAHASAGCLHIRPILDLKTQHGMDALRTIAPAVVALTVKFGGAMSSEHGDGLARGEWLEQMYGPEIADATRKLKAAADPENLLNPGKIVDAPAMDANLRYGLKYQSRAWQPDLSLEGNGGLTLAIEQCNGQGVCRKTDGVMCPSYQATREEMHSTRGRANLLRAMIAAPGGADGALPGGALIEPVAQALDLCLGCKGCKAECPSGVDMAKLKYAFEAEYYKTRRRPAHDYLFGYFHLVAPWMAAVSPIANAGLQNPAIRNITARALGIAGDRPFPKFSRRAARPRRHPRMERAGVIFLSDAFTHFVEPEIEQAAFDVLDSAGYDVRVLPTIVAAAALVSKGFIASARKHATRVLSEIDRIDPAGAMPIVGIEPPELYAVKHDYFDLLPARSYDLAARLDKVWLLEEFLLRSADIGRMRVATNLGKVKFQPHCHQRAEGAAADGLPSGAAATVALLSACGYEVEQIEAGCCGMAGTFGYEREHYELSQRIGELKLVPNVRDSGADAIVSTGAACRLQIEQGTGVRAEHPIALAARAIVAA